MRNKPHPLQLAASLVIDYFRWSQLAPMITMWLFAMLMIFMLFFVNHQDETVDGVVGMVNWVAELPVVGPPLVEWMKSNEGEDGVLHFGGNDFKVTAMKVWVVLSLILMVLGWLTNLVFGPFQPLTLKRKLGFAGLGSLALLTGFFGVRFLSPELFNGPASPWILNFVAIAVLVFLVSVWCLSVAHVLGLVSRSLAASPMAEAAPDELKIDTREP